MSEMANTQVNMGSIREAVVALRSAAPAPPAELQPQAVETAPEMPVTAAPVPEEQVAAPQTDLPVQIDEPFELDLNYNPLDETQVAAPPVEPAAPNKAEWEQEFKVLQTTPRGREILGANREMAKLQEVIGYRPEAEAIQQWHRKYSVMDEMEMDFAAGEPNAAQKFVNYWFGRDNNGTAMPGAEAIAEALPMAIAQENPAAYQRIGAHFGTSLIDQLSQLAQTARPEDAARFADAALVLGVVTGLKPVANGQPTPAADPRLEEAMARIRELEGGRQQVSRVEIENHVYRGLNRALEADAAQILEPIRKSYESTPEKMLVFNAMKEQIVKEMRSAAQKTAIWGEVKKSITRFERAGGVPKEQLDGVVRLWRQGYSNLAPQMRTKYLNAAGLSLTRPADEARGILQQGQNKTAPSAGTAPLQSTPTNHNARKPTESIRDFSRRILHENRAAQQPV